MAPSALKSAQFLVKSFGTPLDVGFPLVVELFPDMDYTGKKILVVHQQVMADSIRKEFRKKGADSVVNASWFMMKKELKEEQDVFLRDEDDYINLVKNNHFDLIVADATMQPMTSEPEDRFMNVRHFAVSGRLMEKV